ncbi:MAG: hypothetical protein ACREUC_05685 [Steroidobacteraceae bacterium]
MSKLEDRATPEMLQWLEAAGGGRPQLAVRPAESSLATARAAHHAVWQSRSSERPAQLISSASNGGARPEDFAFFFHSSSAAPSAVTSDETPVQRRRRQRLLKLALLQAMVGAINAATGGDGSSGGT